MKILIAVIAYDEENNLPDTIRDLKDNNFGYDVLVVDNGSQDNTVEFCRKANVDYISHCINSGSPYGCVTSYFLYAYRNNYDIICQFDGDGQHSAKDIKKIVEPIIKKHANYVVGSRFLSGQGFKSTFMRRIGIRIFSYMNSLIVKHKLTDATSGFKAYDRKVIKFFTKNYKHEIYDINQMLLLAHYASADIVEVPVTMKERRYGVSNFNFINSLKFPINGVINILGCILHKK